MTGNRIRGWRRLAALGLGLLAALWLAACGASSASNVPGRPGDAAERPGPSPAPVAVSSVAAEGRMLPRSLEVTGTLNADARTEVAAETPGRVVQVLVERGQVVAAGAVLVRLDRADAANQLAQAEATEAQTRARLGLAEGHSFDPWATPDVRQARATMERLELDYARYTRLLDEGVLARAEFDRKRAEFLAAREEVEATVNRMRQLYQGLRAQQAAVAIARKALADTVVRAPYGGLVAERTVNVGQYLDRGAKVATLVRVDPLRIELAIPETAAASVRKGQKVSFTVQTYPDRRFEGTIAYVGPALRPDARVLVAEAIVPNGDGTLKPGLFATASIELPAARQSVLVPAAAVGTEAGISKLYVVADGRAELRLVQVGEEAGGLVEIVRGLSAGERVATAGMERLADGVAVADAPARAGGGAPASGAARPEAK